MVEDSSNPYRLPRTVVPRRYELRLEPDLEAFSFAGTVGVDIDVVEPVGEIVLNAAELEISRRAIWTEWHWRGLNTTANTSG